MNVILVKDFFTVGFSNVAFASTEDAGHSMDGHEGHKMSGIGMAAEKGAKVNKTITVHMLDTKRFNFSNKAAFEEGDIVNKCLTCT